MANLMNGTLSAILKQSLDERAKTDADFASKYQTKKFDDCVSAIYAALESMARKAVSGSGGAATCGSDDLLVSAAVHWYDEEKPTTESIVAILEGGTEIIKQNKPTKQAKTADAKPTAKPAPTAKPTAKPAPTPKPTPKPIPKMEIVKPSAAPMTDDDDDDDDDIDLFS